MKIEVCWNVVLGKFPFTIAATKVDRESTSIGNTERVRNVCSTGSSPASNIVTLGGRRLGSSKVELHQKKKIKKAMTC